MSEVVSDVTGRPRLVGWRSRPRPDRGGCERCRWDGSCPRPPALVSVGTSAAYWAEVYRCRACGGFRMTLERGATRLSADEAEWVLGAEPGAVPTPEPLPPVLEVVAEPADRGPDGRWLLPPMPEGLDVGTRGGDLWYLECLALVGDVVYGEEPGSRGRVHTSRWTEQASGPSGSRVQTRGWRIDVPFRMDATRVWDTVDVGRALSHNHWLEPGAPRNGLVEAIGALAGFVPVRGGHELVFVEGGESSPRGE